MQKVHRYFVDNAEIYGINGWIEWIGEMFHEVRQLFEPSVDRESTKVIYSISNQYVPPFLS